MHADDLDTQSQQARLNQGYTKKYMHDQDNTNQS